MTGPQAPATRALMERLMSLIRMGRPGSGEEAANIVAFLASEQASYVTGCVIPADRRRHPMRERDAAALRPAVVLDPYDHRFHWDPYPYYRAAREHDPVYFYEPGGFWLLTKWDDVYRAFRDHKTFINSGAVALEKDANEKLPYPLFIGSDPPELTREQLRQCLHR